MAYVNVAEWKPEQVTEWLKGLDNAVLPYIHSFLNNEVSGQQLLNLRPDDLDHLGVHKLGHQELILEAVEHLRDFHYELDRENLQLLALHLSCRANSLYKELLLHTDSVPVSTQTLADVANVITAVKPLVCWLDRSPFRGHKEYHDRKMELLRLSLEIATCAQRDRFAERPVEEIRSSCKKLADLADGIIQDIMDPLVLQPASLDLATLKKRAGDDLGFFILPSFYGVHQIGEIKFSSPAHQCGKIEEGDEVVQVNYQTVVGWQTKKVMALFEESPTDVFLTLKKRPRHTKVYGQIYMKPYRLPSKKRAAPYSRWNDNLPSPRPELLTIPDFEMPLPRTSPKQATTETVSSSTIQSLTGCSDTSDDDDDDEAFLPCAADMSQASPTSMRLYLPKQRSAVQRRATVTGASPTSKRSPVNIEELLRGLPQEGHLTHLRDKSASVGNELGSHGPSRPATCLGIEGRSKGRGHLDKSYSTPAYDLSEVDVSGIIHKGGVIDEDESNSMKIGKILETVNTALLQQKLRNQNDDTSHDDVGESNAVTSETSQSENIAVKNEECVTTKTAHQEPSTQTGDETVELFPKVAVPVFSSVNIKSKIREAVVPPSPRTIKKRNGLIAKRRNISIRELGPQFDCSGWLLHRCRQGGAGAAWNRTWFILKSTIFYGFHNQESSKADIMIALAGFTAAIADEVKSKKYAFKIYHTGTVFYFAAETEEEMTLWLNNIIDATVALEPSQNPEVVVFSETEEEEFETETCFPSPKVRKFTGILNSGTLTPSTTRSQQNLAAETNKMNDSQRKFGSLKKLSRKAGGSPPDPPPASSSSSLDRKYLRFLGSSRSTAVPVPTARFRSYRRVVPTVSNPQTISVINMAADITSTTNVTTPPASEEPVKTKPRRDPPAIHASNPSLPHLPSDMADYRLAAELLREFGGGRHRQRRDDTTGFVTLEEFMLNRQEEERRNQRQFSGSSSSAVGDSRSASETNTRQAVRSNRVGSGKLRRNNIGEQYKGGSPEKLWIASLRRNDDSKQPRRTPLKTAAQYQPPPAATPAQQQPPRMKLTGFEMHLGDVGKGNSKLKGIFGPPPGQKTLLGSPRLHRAIFRDKKPQPPSELPTSDSPTFGEQGKPTMGITMLGKKPSRRVPPSPCPSPPPDYPGLEYPPVFEPETYTLSDASSLLRSRTKQRPQK